MLAKNFKKLKDKIQFLTGKNNQKIIESYFRKPTSANKLYKRSAFKKKTTKL